MALREGWNGTCKSIEMRRLIGAYLVVLVTAAAAAIELSAPREDVVYYSAQEVAVLKSLRLSGSPSRLRPESTNYLTGDQQAISLGKALFADRGLGTKGLGCVDCHNPSFGWSIPPERMPSKRKGPHRDVLSLFDASDNHWYLRDGRIDTLWGQVAEALVDELGVEPRTLGYLFASRPDLNRLFGQKSRKYEGSSLNEERLVFLAKTLASYINTIKSTPSSFDCFIANVVSGDRTIGYSVRAQLGLKIFLNDGKCITCHFGANLTDFSFHSLGVPQLKDATEYDSGRLGGIAKAKSNRFSSAGPFSDDPLGKRAKLLHFVKPQPNDAGAFRTPGLRNVELTKPYMHNGSLATLYDVVDFYNSGGKSQLSRWEVIRNHHAETILKPLGLEPYQRENLVLFLRTLNDDPSCSEDEHEPSD